MQAHPKYPKGDLRRMLMVLGAIHEAGGATLVQIVARILVRLITQRVRHKTAEMT